jgi:outer membrane protein OmpA-like peptidoglycan-associated protein
MIGLWIIPLFSLISTGDSIPIVPIPVKELNIYRTQYFPIYSASRKELFLTVRKAINSDEEIFVSKWNGKNFETPWPIEELNQENNEGTPTLTKDGKIMIFSGCDYPNSLGGCDLYECHWLDGSWSRPKNLGYKINSHDWEGQPQLSSDGKMLFFSSDRPAGHGKRDIWLSFIENDGTWGLPKNLGEGINTSEDEQGPYFIQSKDILVFSSNQKGGLGGLDFHQSLIYEGIWSKSVPIYEINSPFNEAGFSEGIFNDQYFISKKVSDPNQDLQIHRVDIPDYCWIKKPFVPKPELSILPSPKLELNFEDIQFRINLAILPQETPLSLLNLIEFLNKNLDQNIEIHGHTDEVGNTVANLRLSERRALTVKTFLIHHGIDPKRILTKGFGNTKPKIKNANLEQRKANRRIEIILP